MVEGTTSAPTELVTRKSHRIAKKISWQQPVLQIRRRLFRRVSDFRFRITVSLIVAKSLFQIPNLISIALDEQKAKFIKTND